MSLVMGWEERDVVRAEMASKRSRLFNLRLDTGKAKNIRLLHDAPLSIQEHVWQEDGKWNYKFCWGDGCPYCKDGRKRSFRGVHLVWDYSKWEDRNGETHEGSLLLWKYSATVGDTLKAIHMAIGELDAADMSITKLGAKQNTTYTILPKAVKPISSDVLEQLEDVKTSLLGEDYEFSNWTIFLKDYLEKQIAEDKKNFLPEDSEDSDDTSVSGFDGEDW